QYFGDDEMWERQARPGQRQCAIVGEFDQESGALEKVLFELSNIAIALGNENCAREGTRGVVAAAGFMHLHDALASADPIGRRCDATGYASVGRASRQSLSRQARRA